jgi:MYXO-CTERM domain-containing protein
MRVRLRSDDEKDEETTMRSVTRRGWAAAVATAAVAVAAVGGVRDARAFCGFYVSGAEGKLLNDATQVVLMREGTRTVLSMQNNYQGPPADFAMVIPVPVVLQKENVKTLPREVFDRVDKLTAPRLVEYWEQDPCPKPMRPGRYRAEGGGAMPAPPAAAKAASSQPAVRIEAQFTVGEYQIVILSATDATALDAWLHQNGYKIPDGAGPYLRPYVQMGMKFFVAKVDVSKVRFERIGNEPEKAILSPLRFHYDSDAFNLPIRLGLINSSGTQDLVVTILARGQRYEVANYDNVAIPTNIDVADSTRKEFPSFYATLFDQTLAKHTRSVVTEYSWAADSCDPCPTPPLEVSDLMTLGVDAIVPATPPPPGGGAPILAPPPPPPWQLAQGFVITRLHARYSKDALGDDLFFRAAPPIVGGREFMQGDGKQLEQGARPDSQNNFQARYIIRHPWTGPIACKNPQRGIWGGPPNGNDPGVSPAAKIGFLPRAGNVTLGSFVHGVVPPESFLSAGGPTPLLSIPASSGNAGGVDDASAPLAPTDDAGLAPQPPATPPPEGGCAGCSTGSADATSAGAIAALAALGFARLRRRRG